MTEKTGKKSEVSIIEIIQQMVSSGESEETIVKTLRDLGVDEDKAKRLLLLGQADTFALLRSEISKIVMADVEKGKPALIKHITAEAEKAGEKIREHVEKQLLDDVKKYEKELGGKAETFQSAINENVTKLAGLSNEVRTKLNEMGKELGRVKLDVSDVRLRGLSGKGRLVGLLLLTMGVVFLAVDLFLFVTTFNMALSIDTIIVTIVIALMGITMLFVATVV